MRRFKPKFFFLSYLGIFTLTGCSQSNLNTAADDSFIAAPVVKPKELSGDLLYFAADKKNLFRYSFQEGKTTQITNSPAQYYSPQWSHDKKQIVFSSDVHNPGSRAPQLKTWEIYICNRDGSRLRQVTHNRGSSFNPAFLTKNRLLFTNFMNAKRQTSSICALDADGKNFRHLAQGLQEQNASPSQSGRKIAFVAQAGGATEIFSMNADGSNRKRLTFNTWREQSPVWSPDERKIAFVSRRNGNFDIWLMDADGSDQRRLTSSESMETSPCFSPDGRKIAFNSGRSNKKILVMGLDGSSVQQLGLEGDNRYPSWR